MSAQRVVSWRGVALGGVLCAAAFGWGRLGAPPEAAAQAPAPAREAGATAAPEPARRVVAYIHGNIPITREELGDYLIARMDAERFDLFVNSRIIEHSCKLQGVELTESEIDVYVAEAMQSVPNVTRKEFEQKVLKPRNLTFFEWKYDVIRPKLLMTKLARGRVSATQDDLKLAFEAYYGERVVGRLIMWPGGEKKRVQGDLYAQLRSSDEEFDRAAKMQANPTLASAAGRMPQPIGRGTTGNPELEKAAFSLRPGELSHVIEESGFLAVFKCDKRIPPDATKSLADPALKARLEREVVEKKVQLEIPKVFKEMRDRADPKIFLALKGDVEKPLKEAVKDVRPASKAPTGN